MYVLPKQKEGVAMREMVAKGLRSLRPFYIDIPRLRPGTAGAYALALVAVGVAAALQLALYPYVEGAHFLTFFPAIVITTLISGLGAGLLCAILSTAVIDFLVLPTRLSFSPESSADWVTLLLFGPLSAYLVILIAGMRSAIEREQEETSKARLQLALDTAQIGWWRYDPHRNMVAADKRLQEIFDVFADELPVEEAKKLVHPDDVERFWSDHVASMHPAAPKPPPREYRIARRSGEVRWIEVHRLAHFDRDQRVPSIVGTAYDITERKQREEREHLLMREVSHRAKNMLSVVNTIAHQTAAKSPEDFIERFSQRIQALAANQDLLIRNEWHGVEIGDLVRAQIAPFADHIGTRIMMHGPTLHLNAAAAQAIGLALHELTTNAGKYGALSKHTGRLDIGWATDGETFTMNWTERGGPPVSAPQRRGFGSVVMHEMAERSLDGKVDLTYAPSGVTLRLICPATNALEPRPV
jgi:PAS domain S-box-containing protein